MQHNKLALWLLNVFLKNFNVSPSSWLNIPASERQQREDEEHSR